MAKNIILAVVFLFVMVFANPAFAKVTIVPGPGQVRVITTENDVVLEGGTQVTVGDGPGGSANVFYDGRSGGTAVEAISGDPKVIFGIAEIFLDETERVDLFGDEAFKRMLIRNQSPTSNIEVVFPDGSKVMMPSDAVIVLLKLADNNYHLTVMIGEVEYFNPEGIRQILTPNSPPILIRGFGIIPDWRKTDLERNPVTP
jgi:hypothetical protein